MFKYCRNPNYLGEMMLYGKYKYKFDYILGSFAGLTGNSYCYAVLICVWGIYFNMNMQIKDISLSKKSGWDEYRKQSWLVVPKLFGESDSKNMIGYGLLIMIWIGIY